ncbi:hypothetical protein HDA40_004150 [Hamadaea flava]|uniref:Uncharacterized protein n=1 Tax=Hamadaea flava TaxID=1742688 RepID=A0ABV8LIQ3_9ACTN|nr:hypothetical protein [Hamadaea flava]MCP2325643.1 hypothetical protein [Hamadaea flava]
MSASKLRRGLVLGMLAAVIGGGAAGLSAAPSVLADFDWNSPAAAVDTETHSVPQQDVILTATDFDWN